MDGFDLLARVRERPACARVPAVFLTAKDEPFDRVSGLALGADDYLAKPFLPQELVLRIAAVLRRLSLIHIWRRCARGWPMPSQGRR